MVLVVNLFAALVAIWPPRSARSVVPADDGRVSDSNSREYCSGESDECAVSDTRTAARYCRSAIGRGSDDGVVFGNARS